MKDKLIFPTCPEAEFFGRKDLISGLCSAATEDKGIAPGIFLVGRYWVGKTEVLRRVHNELYWGQAGSVPVYFQLSRSKDPAAFAEDFLRETLKQILAFRTRTPELATHEVSLERLEAELEGDEEDGLYGFIKRHKEAKRAGDALSQLRNALSLPCHSSKAGGGRVFLILDDIDESARMRLHGTTVLKEFLDAVGRGSTAFLASSRLRRIPASGLPTGAIEINEMSGLGEEASISMLTELCRNYGIAFDTEILRLASSRLEGNPMYMKNMVWAARRSGGNFETLKDFVDLYAVEVTEGNIAFALRSLISLKGQSGLKVLNHSSRIATDASLEDVTDRLRLKPDEAAGVAEDMASRGILETNLGAIKWDGDTVTKDFVHFAYETMVRGKSADEARTQLVREWLKSGYSLRSVIWQGRLKSDCESLLKAFNGQSIPRVLFNNRSFSARCKNNGTARKNLEAISEDEPFLLPQIVGTFDTLRHEKAEAPPIVVAHGFQNNRYDANNEVVWLAGIKEALQPVNIGDIENFVRRCAILRENFKTTRIVRWMIGREGFSSEAIKRIDAEGVYSSDIVQLGMIKSRLEEQGGKTTPAAPAGPGVAPIKEFEVILPSASKAELVAARAAEEIGTEMGFDEHAIGQIKSALVEACINAFEHSKTRLGRVFLRFIASNDRLTIHVQNQGTDLDRLSGKGAVEEASGPETMPHRRGWGIELMRGLMDEVRLENIRNGAKIVMVKYLIQKGDGSNEKQF
ncbi:MAG: ATP-binding protein [Deltaproteobacteria bacterium]